jgi:F-type H+-transporting ATPase subunit a
MHKGLLKGISTAVFALVLGVTMAQDHGHQHGAGDGHGHPHPAATPVDTAHAHPHPATTQAGPDAGAQTGAAHDPHAGGAAHDPCAHHDEPFNASENAIHHIADANAVHIYGDLYLPLPALMYAPTKGWSFFSSTNKFHPHHHGNGTIAIDGYVLAHGNVLHIIDQAFPAGEQTVECVYTEKYTEDGKDKERSFALVGGKAYALDKKSSWDGGLMGGGITSFYDFSITRNLFAMILSCLALFVAFRSAASSMAKRVGQAPKGIQNFLEPLVEFIRDDIARPNIGEHKYEKFMPLLLSIFFFILGLNLLGQIPFFPGGANVTGALTVTMVLALVVFVVVNINGNKHYWSHIFNMPGVPKPLLLIITPVEILGVFIKPFTLLLRLFANITAGHIVILSFVSLIFIFGKAGESLAGTGVGIAISVPLTIFAMALELLVAFLQAYVFTLLTAVYLGGATEEAHH